MRLVRLGERGSEIPGVQLSNSSTVLDARPVTADFNPEFFASDGIARLRAAVKNDELAPLRDIGMRIGAPIAKPEKSCASVSIIEIMPLNQAWRYPRNQSSS